MLQKGFVEDYYDWRYHYDIAASEISNTNNAFVRKEVHVPSPTHNPEENNYVRMVHDAATSRFSDTYQNFFPQNDYDNVQEQSLDDVIPKEPNPQAKKFFEMLSAANNPLYDGYENYSQMSIMGRMTNLKTEHNCSERMYDVCAL